MNFAEQLRESTDDNLLEKRIERRKKDSLDKVYEKIKSTCIYASEKGLDYVSIDLKEHIFKEIFRDDDLELFIKHAGVGHHENNTIFIEPETIKSHLGECLKKDGIINFEFKELMYPIFKMKTVETENSTATKALSATFNLFFDANLDVNRTVREKKVKIGESVREIILKIRW